MSRAGREVGAATAFRGTTAVVTGASSGIGRAIASDLAEAGVSAIGVHYCNNRAGAEETAEHLRGQGCRPQLLQADLADAGDAARLVAESFRLLGPIQTWVNNAGADVLTGAAADWDFETKLSRLLAVDVVGTIRLSRLVADRLTAASGPGDRADGDRDDGDRFDRDRADGERGESSAAPPSITFIGWDQASGGMEGDAGQMFGPVKAAVTAYASSLAQTLAPRVRVNTVAPGWIRTAWGETASDAWVWRARRQSLMGRWGRPEDVARAVRFLADPGNRFVTGQTLDVNGGFRTWPFDAPGVDPTATPPVHART